MPTYQYRCKECAADLEVVQKFTDDALTTCPACGRESLRKVYNAVGVHFKGSGFYRTDSRSGGSGTGGSGTTKGKDSTSTGGSSSGSSSSGGSSSGSSSGTASSTTSSTGGSKAD